MLGKFHVGVYESLQVVVFRMANSMTLLYGESCYSAAVKLWCRSNPNLCILSCISFSLFVLCFPHWVKPFF